MLFVEKRFLTWDNIIFVLEEALNSDDLKKIPASIQFCSDNFSTLKRICVQSSNSTEQLFP